MPPSPLLLQLLHLLQRIKQHLEDGADALHFHRVIVHAQRGTVVSTKGGADLIVAEGEGEGEGEGEN